MKIVTVRGSSEREADFSRHVSIVRFSEPSEPMTSYETEIRLDTQKSSPAAVSAKRKGRAGK